MMFTYNMRKNLNKGISTPIGILIIVLVVVILGGGILAWQYFEMPKSPTPTPETTPIPTLIPSPTVSPTFCSSTEWLCSLTNKCVKKGETCCNGMPGGCIDEHNCNPTAGYTWCESKQKCLRTWEEQCSQAPKPLPQPSLKEPQAEITARPVEVSNSNENPISTIFGALLVHAQELETGKELQIEIREAPPKEITSFQTWTIGYTIKNTTDSSFSLSYDVEPSEYKTSGAVVVDLDGNGPEQYFYYTFGEEVLLKPKSEQYFDMSLSPPKGLTEITPRVIFKGFSTEKPLFDHEFTVKVTYTPPPAECEIPVCPEGKVLYWNGSVDDYNKCLSLWCSSPEIGCAMSTLEEGGCDKYCAVIAPKGECAVSRGIQCVWKLPLPEGWTMVDKCP